MFKRYSIRTLIIFLLLIRFQISVLSQSINYQVVFGDDWNKALAFEKENRSWMEPLLIKNHIPYPLAIAVIFPELVRYSALRDKMEITLLKALYVNLGDEYANFSIGQFQMKPSFAEFIHEQAPGFWGLQTRFKFSKREEFDDITNFRKSIVIDLEDPKTQFYYLIAFLKIAEHNFGLKHKDNISKLKFLATAYNYGINKSSEQIESMIDKKFFNTKLFKTDNYSYADVSLFWYNQFMAENK
jgi:hypothetical protein